jgi:hypothetical protein
LNGSEGAPERRQQAGEHGEGFSPLYPTELPPELADALRSQSYCCVTTGSDGGTIFVVKAPGADISSASGTVPIGINYELYEHPRGPVIRTVITIHDQPECPLVLETFINVGDPTQRADFAALAKQSRLVMLFYDEGLVHRLSKVVANRARERLETLLSLAESQLAGLPPEQVDFELAKRAVMQSTSI